MKRIFSLALVFLLSLSLFGSVFAQSEVEKLTVAVVRNYDDHSEGYSTKPIVIAATEATGIQVEWIEIAQSALNERVAVMLASGDLPDVFLNCLNTDLITANSTLFTPLGDYVEEYAPQMTEYFNLKGDYYWDLCTYADGNMYSLLGGYVTSPANDSSSLPMINEVWLKKLGLQVPTTLDEYYNVLVAFRDQDPNGNGIADEIPLSFCDNYWASYFSFYTGNFGFTNYWRITDGEVEGVVGSDAYREMIDFYHKLYSEKLLDMEGFSQTEEQYKAKLKNGIVGVWYGWRPGVELAGAACADDYYVFFPPQAEAYTNYPSIPGQSDKFTGNIAMFAVTNACEDVGKALKWWDYFYTNEETRYSAIQGEKGLVWDIIDGVVYEFTPTTEQDPQGYGRAYWRYYYSLGSGGPAVEYSPFYGYESDRLARLNLTNNIRSKVPTFEEGMPTRLVPSDFVAMRKNIESDLLDYIKSFTANAVLSGIDDTGWEEHLSMLKAYKYDEWINWYQQYYDGNF